MLPDNVADAVPIRIAHTCDTPVRVSHPVDTQIAGVGHLVVLQVPHRKPALCVSPEQVREPIAIEIAGASDSPVRVGRSCRSHEGPDRITHQMPCEQLARRAVTPEEARPVISQAAGLDLDGVVADRQGRG